MIGFLGTAFAPVKSDINGNVVKVRTRYEKDKEGMIICLIQYCLLIAGQRYLQDLIDKDLQDNGGKLGIATEGLLWLKRYFQSIYNSVFVLED